MNEVFLWIKHIVEQFSLAGYVVLAVVALFESLPIIGLFTPGGIILVIGGVLAAEGLLELSSVLVIASLGAIAGDLISFAFGRHFQTLFKGQHRFLKPEYLARADAFTARWGKKSILLSRFIGPLRSIVSLVSGITKTRWLTFILLDAPGTILFMSFHVLLGYFAASAWQSVEGWAGRAGSLLLGLIVVALVLWWLKNFFVRQGREIISISAIFLKTNYERLIGSRFWKKFATLRPRSALFFEHRFNPMVFSGLTMSAMLIGAAVCLVFSILIGIQISGDTNIFINYDERIRAIILLFSNSYIAASFFMITSLGSFIFICTVTALALFWFWLERRLSYSLGLLISVVGGLLTSSLLKMIFARARPAPSFYYENSFSYPSSHAVFVIAFGFFIAYYAIKAYPRWSRNINAVLIASVVALLVGLSRMYLGVHYASDVIGGYLVAGAWLMIGIIVQRKFERLDNARRLKKSLQLIIIGFGSLVLFGVLSTYLFERNNLREFYYSSASIDRHLRIDLQENRTWPSITENVRGGRERPVSLIILSEEASLRDALSRYGWNERPQPSISNLSQELLNVIMKKNSELAPIRPRFWSNQPNDITFVKYIERGEQSDSYILRLWRSSDKQDKTLFISEISVNRDFSIPLPPSVKIILAEAQIELLKDLSQEPNYHEERFIRESAHEYEEQFIIPVISL